MVPFEEAQPGNRLTTLGKFLDPRTPTEPIILYERQVNLAEEDRDPRLADAEASAE